MTAKGFNIWDTQTSRLDRVALHLTNIILDIKAIDKINIQGNS